MKRIAGLLCLLLLAAPAAAQAKKRPMQLDDLFKFKRVSDPQVSPDGRWVVYAVATVDDLRAVVQELGYKAYLAEWVKGSVLVDAGRAAEAIDPLELAASNAGERGDVSSASSILGLLARALALAGHMDAAARRSADARAVTSPSDRWSALLWRGAAARVCAAEGRRAECRTLADEVVAILADIDYPGIEFHARLDAAAGYEAAGERRAAEALLRRALADSRERGASGFVRQAEAALERVGAEASA